jgi:hypothetical protein
MQLPPTQPPATSPTHVYVQDFDPNKDQAQCSSSLCRFNLHSLACQLHVQNLYMGLTCYFLEYWLEREMGCAKARTRGKVTAKPAHVVVTMELDNRAQHEAALALGMVLEESEEDGHLIIPSTSQLSSGSGSLQAYAQAAAAIGRYRLPGIGHLIEAGTWDALQVCGNSGSNQYDVDLWKLSLQGERHS